MLTYSVLTDVGSRNVNEDSIAVFENGANKCFVLCDGLGGHGMGDVASQTATAVFGSVFSQSVPSEGFLHNAFSTAQQTILAKQRQKNVLSKMKTTAVALCVDEKKAYFGHIGDSRLYIFSKNKLKMRTLDHSVVQMLVLSKEIKESEIRRHPERNMILNVMGVHWDEPMYELAKPAKLKKNMAFLLCSDGFWELIEENKMCELLKKSTSVEAWLFEMAQVVKKNGEGLNMDNYSAIAVWNN